MTSHGNANTIPVVTATYCFPFTEYVIGFPWMPLPVLNCHSCVGDRGDRVQIVIVEPSKRVSENPWKSSREQIFISRRY